MSFTANLNDIIAENRNGLLSSHPSWCRVTLSDIAEVLNGYPFDSKSFNATSGHPLIRIRDVLRGCTDTYYTGDAPEEFWIAPGEILIGMDGDFNAARWRSSKALLNQRVLRLKNKNPEYFNEGLLFHLIGGYLQAINEHTASVTVKHLSSRTVLSIPLPLPPLAEQNHIAQKLDELQAQVNTLKARIDAIPPLFKRLRKSVLAAAVSGRLTEDWRAKQSSQSPQGKSGPPGWIQTVFGDICREITVGYVGKMADQYRDDGVPFLRSQNVRPLRFSPDNIQYISEEFHSAIFKSRLEPGDLAIVRSGAPGVTCVIPDSLPIANCSDLVIARPSETLNSWFGCIYMNSEVAQRNVADNKVGVAQQHFNVSSMKKMPINLPPIEEQTEIVRRTSQFLTIADLLEAKVATAKARIEGLTQSIWAKAFRGELTADWRTANQSLINGEHSAEALLEKIMDAREIEKAKPKPKKIGINRKTDNAMGKETIKVVDALKIVGEPLTGQLLLAAAGYPSDSDTEQLEQFFLDIRDALENQQIVKQYRDDSGQDWFALAEAHRDS
jgi:type I restriction enzyme S subunit